MFDSAAPFVETDLSDGTLAHDYQTPRGIVRFNLPRYVRACRRDEWSLHLWDPRQGGDVLRVPYRCNSWRCPGECRARRARRDMRRICDALRPVDAEHVCFLVLTLDRNGTLGGRPWSSRYEAFTGLSRCARILMKRLNRALERARQHWLEAARAGEELDTLGPCPAPIGNAWVAVAEQHQTGWPHLNLLIVSPYLAHRLRQAYDERSAVGLSHRESSLVAGELRRHVVASGFGVHSTGEVARSKGDVAFYVAKAAASIENASTFDGARAILPREVAKLTQVPEASPPGFRRLRSGVRFLPRKKKSQYTGVLLGRDDQPIGGAVTADEQVVGLLGAMIGEATLPRPRGLVLDAECGVVTPSEQVWPEIPGVPSRRYTLRPYDPSDPKQKPQPIWLVPDPSGFLARVKIGGRWRRISVRAERASILLIDFTDSS